MLFIYDLVVMGDVVDGLIDDVHEDGGEVSNNKNIGKFPLQDQHHLHCPGFASFHGTWDEPPVRQNILIDK